MPALQACLAQQRGAGQLRHELGYFLRRARLQATIHAHDQRLLHPGLLAQAFELRDELRARSVGELERHGACLRLQLDQHLIDRLLTEIHAAFQRRVDFDVEP